eukprot:CAMPEP_0206448962 /NCGR_PEP_ID=MMETSP0324_2-20121206/17804_1 /ASSEMBLY_ACC=CAM_ASM_000836 /TAXON_ID=2866 /ORGANISM="Crypthecodinium cohnii, Strain Seligo" /LENGTH=284 /DNA_ID=CAMNT_0053918245 /DNA_START=67 /DNA_END=921 /DNA_ORIENTATION=-
MHRSGFRQEWKHHPHDNEDDYEDYDDDDSDDERADREMQLLQEACLPVSGAPLCPSNGPPQNADEYLRQVQWERMHCPEVVCADLDEAKLEKKTKRPGSSLDRFSAALENDESSALNALWVEDISTSFVALRSYFQATREQLPEPHQRLTFVQWKQHCAKARPSAKVLRRQTYVSLGRLLVVVSEAFIETVLGPEGETSKSPPSLPDVQVVDRLSEWVFAALAYLELPLMDDCQYQLQRLRRCCMRLLSAAAAAPPSESDAARTAALAHAGMLLTIVTEVFGQR